MAEFPEFRPMVHLDEMGHFMGDKIIDHRGRRHADAPGEGKDAVRGARSPAAFRILETHRFRLAADSRGVADDKRLDLALHLALDVVGNAARQMCRITMNEQDVAFKKLGGAAPRLVHDLVRHAAQGDFDTGAHARLVRQFCDAAFNPACVAVEKAQHFAFGKAGRNRDTQSLAAGFDAQGQPFGTGIFENAQGKFPPSDRVNAFAANGCRPSGCPFAADLPKKGKAHHSRISDSFKKPEKFASYSKTARFDRAVSKGFQGVRLFQTSVMSFLPPLAGVFFALARRSAMKRSNSSLSRARRNSAA